MPLSDLGMIRGPRWVLSGPDSGLFMDFMKSHSCYETIPTSSKVLLLDTKLKVKAAFVALVCNGLRAAPLWDSRRQHFVGMLTITDFINVLHCFYKSPRLCELERHRIDTWRGLAFQKVYLKNSHHRLISVSANSSLFEAVFLLLRFKIHRLPVVDPESGNVLHILTHKRLLKFLHLHLQTLPRPGFLDRSVLDLGIGTFSDLAVIRDSDRLISALTLFVQRRVSALPVVDQQGRVVGLYSRFDVINLAAQKSYSDLEVTMRETLRRRTCFIEGVIKCYPQERLETVLHRIVQEQVHRLVMVDSSDRVLGIVSLSDLLQALVLSPAGINALLP
ncbi:5'-AMP-activated protein kinase subunit gamma-3 isoform X2 [Boleophthalmus pectinirostris]|uniref:5'-AMP-activated protein kinase subunit gamma-3 isoform X2 n=1 Tax=Boleophthalmus pectinirostris TaxID=150288 RepID=UPI00242CC0DB|nr:5'-AMP-activated protein kinase subunit gamma-3 isoform X2 [Boleophthalmus pectinirostris]